MAGANIQVEGRLREEVERFFAGYRDAFNDADPAAVARHVAVPSLLVQRETTLWAIERSEGRAAWNFHTGYNMRREDNGVWRIVCCTAYEEVGVRQRMG